MIGDGDIGRNVWFLSVQVNWFFYPCEKGHIDAPEASSHSNNECLSIEGGVFCYYSWGFLRLYEYNSKAVSSFGDPLISSRLCVRDMV